MDPTLGLLSSTALASIALGTHTFSQETYGLRQTPFANRAIIHTTMSE
jgi:hypothetical protein